MPHLLDLAGFLLLWRLAKITGQPDGDVTGWAEPPGVSPDAPPAPAGETRTETGSVVGL
jgi:hypothetical protein